MIHLPMFVRFASFPMPVSDLKNPFQCDTVVDGSFSSVRKKELTEIRQILCGRNHLALISPRRYGKTSLVRKAVRESGRPAMFVNVQMAMSAACLAGMLLKAFLAIHPSERFKDALKSLRVRPTLFYNPDTNSMDVSFDASIKGFTALEDVLTTLDEKSDPQDRLIVVLDEFQEVMNLEPGTGKLLRGVMQQQKNINYLFSGSDEGMMRAIFEDIKSPFSHFGALMRPGRIPYEDFHAFLSERLAALRKDRAREDASQILELTQCHPFYTQQLATIFWDLCVRSADQAAVSSAADAILRSLSPTYLVLWSRLNRTNRRILEVLSRGSKLQEIQDVPSSTVYSAVARLKKEGLLIKDEDFALEDPFFALWIRRSMQLAAVGLPPAGP